ncbi:hypothetical protein JYU20_00360 [Bacteroidales bacterium AH-315-I05]|nr:hypothetical protein [Bacteroidales bacterium AH-315-I05]
MKTLKIEKEAAAKAYNNASKAEKKLLVSLFGKKVFQDYLMSRIKTFGDVLKANGTDKKEFDKLCSGLEEDEIAYRKIKLICKALNEGWEPNWNDSNESKHCPWFKMSASGLVHYGQISRDTHPHVSSRLCFKSAELANYVGKRFIDIYAKFILIN